MPYTLRCGRVFELSDLEVFMIAQCLMQQIFTKKKLIGRAFLCPNDICTNLQYVISICQSAAIRLTESIPPCTKTCFDKTFISRVYNKKF